MFDGRNITWKQAAAFFDRHPTFEHYLSTVYHAPTRSTSDRLIAEAVLAVKKVALAIGFMFGTATGIVLLAVVQWATR